MPFFLIFGWGTKVKALPGVVYQSLCSVCNEQRNYGMTASYKYFDVFWIPLFSWNTRYFLHCNVCLTGVELSTSQIEDLISGNPKPLASVGDVMLRTVDRLLQVRPFKGTQDG
ncbi:MAG: zinc-ribbon domain-containing protein [Chloroflexi bacterium]|nr:zinc-ribbon domain-containing protein [Chloroflexota bacterium]